MPPCSANENGPRYCAGRSRWGRHSAGCRLATCWPEGASPFASIRIRRSGKPGRRLRNSLINLGTPINRGTLVGLGTLVVRGTSVNRSTLVRLNMLANLSTLVTRVNVRVRENPQKPGKKVPEIRENNP